jgi:hypothetical protein
MDVRPDFTDEGARLGIRRGISGRVMIIKIPAMMILSAPARK